jgi:hypothetical protein
LKKKVLHLVVGFGIYEYFVNSINSVIKYDENSDILIIITGNPKFFAWQNKYCNFLFDYEYDEISKVENFINKLKIKNKVFFKKIYSRKSGKTGSLYDAYNYALKLCKDSNYDYLNIIQNDMQLLFWNNNLIQLIDELFKKNKNTLQIITGFRFKGVGQNIYKQLSNKKKIYLKTLKKRKNIFYSDSYGIADWGIINLNRAYKSKLFFEKNETYMSSEYRKRGFVNLYIPTPFVGVLPWPAAARKGKVVGIPHTLTNDNLLLKSVTKNLYNNLVNYNNELWQEDWLKPFGWYALNPCCYTDFKIGEYFQILLSHRKNRHKSFLRYISYDDDRSLLINFTFKDIRPRIVFLIFIYFYNNFLSLVKRVSK